MSKKNLNDFNQIPSLKLNQTRALDDLCGRSCDF